MRLEALDWIIIGGFFAVVLGIGLWASRTAGKSSEEFFLGGRGMPWWLLGISMVACTFSADTPNLVTGMVRENGVAKNWAWWAFLLTGMITVFVYAKLWRRSGIMTDLEYYELRYSGKAASFLRGFRSIYLGIFFNCLIMGTTTLAAIKIGGIMLGLEPWVVVAGASVIVVIYVALGGLKGVIWADLFQFSISMLGAVYAAAATLKHPKVNGLKNLIQHPDVTDKLSFFPDFSDPSVYIPLLIIPLAVQWWAVWYPGAEPGGGGYIAQRMFAAKDEKNAIGATMLFNFAHYAIRPWPWIIVALASIIVYPDLASIKADYPTISDTYLKDDIAYPALLGKLESGWMGLIVASLAAAYISTIGTHLNWGSSYIVNDFYKRFVNTKASQKELVRMGRITIAVLMILTGFISLTFLDNATQAFNILLLSGAGSGAIYLLRWFWWRINAWSEISAMITSFVTAVTLVLFVDDSSLATKTLDGFTVKLLIGVCCTSIIWLVTTMITSPVKKETLISFYKRTYPGGPGWKVIADEIKKTDPFFVNDQPWKVPNQLLMAFIGCIVIYALLFSTGSFLYGNILVGVLLSILGMGNILLLIYFFKKIENV